MVLLYPFAAFLSAFFALLTWALSPLLALFVRRSPQGALTNLPRCLYWFQTFDNDFTSGPQSMGWAPGYWSSVRWLLRNPAYGFDLFLLGLPFTQGSWTVVADRPDLFFAYNRWGAFSYRGKWFKWGWKAWARLSGPPNWTQFDKIPVVVLR